jgi:hypothetical protein
VPDGGAPDAGEWVDAGVAVAQSWRRVDVDRRIGLQKKRRKHFGLRGHFAVAEDVISWEAYGSPFSFPLQFRVQDGLSMAFLSSKAGFGSLVFVWASGFLVSKAARKPKRTPP